MHTICRIDIGKGEKTYREIDHKLKGLAKILRKRYNAEKIIAFGSYVRGELNEGSDIDILIVGDFEGKFHKRIADVIGLTDLPIEPLCYTEDEFRAMKKNTFISEVLKEGIEL